MRVIVVANQKGGCGKTTTAINTAAALALQGQRVLLVDLDAQGHSTLGLGFDRGTFYSGWITRWNLRCSVRVSNRFQAALDYDQRDVDLAEGDFTTRLASLKTVLTPAPGLSWTSRLQYDNVSDTVGLNSRLRWIVAEGNDIFLILNQGWEAGGGRFRRESRNVKVKVAWTFQF